MKIVTCTLPNASTLISGIAFADSGAGMVSEPVSNEVAEQFVSIPGYTATDTEETPKAPAKAGKAPKAPEADQTPKE